jgi:hypothetical protein
MGRVASAIALGPALLVAAVGCSSSSSGAGAPDGAATSSDRQSAATPSACHWPASLDDAGPGACTVGRAYVECVYPSGVSCEAGGGAFSPGGLTMGCISDDPTSCTGCASTAGAATCTDKCGPNEYAVSCGGPPHPPSGDGGSDDFVYQQAPSNCVDIGGTPGGNVYSCCPCE